MRTASLALAAALTLLVAPPALGASPSGPSGGELRMNHVQARGTHNSYHRDPGHPVAGEVGWDYSHPPLQHQLEHQDVRQVELDIHYNAVRDDFEVYHVPLVDGRTTCELLRECLAELRAWSDAHPDHAPLLVMVEPKDGGPPRNTELPEDGDPFTTPIGEAEYVKLDAILREAFGGSLAEGGRLVTPDDVTAPGQTLRASIVEDGWPRLRDVRQTVHVVLDGDEHGRDYSRGWTDLSGRAVFVQAGDLDAVAAYVRRSGGERPGEARYDRVRRVVADGFMVRDLVGPDGFEASKAAGVHYLSTDFPEELHLGDDPEAPMRCNPIAAPRSCGDRRIERHSAHAADGYAPPPDTTSDEPDAVAADLARIATRKVEDVQALVERSGG